MSTTQKTSTGRRTRRAASTATDTTATDTTATDTTTADTTSADAPATGATATDTAVPDTADGPAVDGASGGAVVVEGPDAGVTEDESATWEQAVPWLALQVGSRPSAPEIAIAVPVWNMLQQAPGATALRLAADAEALGVALDPAAVGRVLARYERAGIVVSTLDGAVTRWSPITPGAIIARVKSGMASSATSGLSGGARTVRASVAAGSSLPGGLRASVAEHLAAHQGEDFSPTEISRALGGRSTGAISKACERLVGDRVAVRTSDRPCRYQHTGTTDPTGGDQADGDATDATPTGTDATGSAMSGGSDRQ